LDNGPAFAVGARVQVKHNLPDSHTRRPGYTRGRHGVVAAHAGRPPLADAGARGEIRNEHLYSVAFEAAELWPEAEGSRDKVYVDLWESYLETP
jgi:nitrile hydratase